MKKILSPLLALALAIVFAACQAAPNSSVLSSPAPSESSKISSAVEEGVASSSQLAEPSEAPAESSALEDSPEAVESSVLIAYFSWAENAVLEEGVDAMTSPSVSDPGNVQQLAGWIQEETGGELFSIQVTDPYPSDWDACLERANQERAEDARPELTASVEQLERYDTVFLGYPNWWYGVPMALLSFLEENDLSDKQVYLFCSHGTGGLASSVEQIDEALPDSTALSENIFDVYEEDAASSQQDILAWLEELGY